MSNRRASCGCNLLLAVSILLLLNGFSQGWTCLRTSFYWKQQRQRQQPIHSRLFLARNFAQPAFVQNQTLLSPRRNRSRRKSGQKPSSDSAFWDLHQERIQTAGRVGTKRFVNPNQIFLGNLPFNLTSEKVLEDWICDQMAVPAPILLHKVKIVKHWKTHAEHRSKGYAFCWFTTPHYATVAIQTLDQKAKIFGRTVICKQGQKKPDETIVLLREKYQQKQQNQNATTTVVVTPELQAQRAALAALNAEEYALLARLDPDLVVNEQEVDANEVLAMDDDDDDDYDGWDPELFPNQDDNDDGEDGVSNRAQRRDASKRKKKKKVVHKGFG